ncbi:MAG: aldehyde dehydrogenase [Oscillospiraceae bacterium]
MDAIQELVAKQRAFFAKGETKEINFRLNALKKLQLEIRLREKEIAAALQQDLGKHPFEGYMAEIGLTLEELSFIAQKLPRWAKDKKVKTGVANFPGKSFIHYEPYGVALIMAPWNYPFLLSLAPLIGAVAAGNCAVLKPSAYAPATSGVIRALVESCFAPGHVAVVEGGRAENSALMEQRFDYIFFTGSVEVGKLVMQKAAANLTPVSLELGGKSPCIVDETADIELAGRRIAFGKFLNAGQTCIAPDYLLVQQSVKQPLLEAIQRATEGFFGEEALQSPELPKIVNQKHFDRLCGLLQSGEVFFGGQTNAETLQIAPTVLTGVLPGSPIMQEEIFGPLLPVLTFDVPGTAISFVNSREKPLALYLFSNSKETQQQVLQQCSFGGGCINDTVMHIASTYMGFGGVGHSGMGNYHGVRSFKTFSHEKSILKKGTWLDVKLRYHPYTKFKSSVVKKILK